MFDHRAIGFRARKQKKKKNVVDCSKSIKCVFRTVIRGRHSDGLILLSRSMECYRRVNPKSIETPTIVRSYPVDGVLGGRIDSVAASLRARVRRQRGTNFRRTATALFFRGSTRALLKKKKSNFRRTISDSTGQRYCYLTRTNITSRKCRARFVW